MSSPSRKRVLYPLGALGILLALAATGIGYVGPRHCWTLLHVSRGDISDCESVRDELLPVFEGTYGTESALERIAKVVPVERLVHLQVSFWKLNEDKRSSTALTYLQFDAGLSRDWLATATFDWNGASVAKSVVPEQHAVKCVQMLSEKDGHNVAERLARGVLKPIALRAENDYVMLREIPQGTPYVAYHWTKRLPSGEVQIVEVVLARR